MSARLSPEAACRLLFAAAFLAHLTLNFARGPGAILDPALAFEDGRDVFAFYYAERDPASVLRFFAGYVSLLPNLLGYLTLALEPVAAALALRVLPWLLDAFALALFVLPPWRAVVPSDALRFAMSLALAVLPLQDFGMVSMTMYSLWSLLLIQCWLAALPAPRRNAWLALSVLVQCAAAWSNPLSLLLLPLYAARALAAPADRRTWWACGVPCLAIAAYYALGVRPTGGGLADPLRALALAADYVVQRVCFELAASSSLRAAFTQRGLGFVPRWLGAALLLAACGALAWLWRRRAPSTATRWACLAALYLVPAATLLFVVARDPGNELFASSFGQRYFFLQKIALVLAGVCVLHDVWPLLAARLSRRALGALAALGVAYLLVLNGLDRPLYSGLPEEVPRTRAFLASLRAAELRGTREAVRLERGEWSVAVIAR